MSAPDFDVAVVGRRRGWGSPVARACGAQGLQVLVLEARITWAPVSPRATPRCCTPASTIPPGSLKALLCVRGREALYQYCADRQHSASPVRQAGRGHQPGTAPAARKSLRNRPFATASATWSGCLPARRASWIPPCRVRRRFSLRVPGSSNSHALLQKPRRRHRDARRLDMPAHRLPQGGPRARRLQDRRALRRGGQQLQLPLAGQQRRTGRGPGRAAGRRFVGCVHPEGALCQGPLLLGTRPALPTPGLPAPGRGGPGNSMRRCSWTAKCASVRTSSGLTRSITTSTRHVRSSSIRQSRSYWPDLPDGALQPALRGHPAQDLRAR